MNASLRHVVSLVLVLALQRPTSQAQIYATVVTEAKTPVSGLATADFVLREGGTRLGVLNAVRATEPLSVAIVTHGFEAADWPDVRRAIVDLVRAVTAAIPGSAAGLVVPDAGAVRVTMLTAGAPEMDTAALAAAAGRSSFVEAIVAACHSLQQAPPDRRTVLALVRRKPGDVDARARGGLTAAILESRAALWTVEVPASPAAPRSPVLDEALAEGIRLSGAVRETAAGAADVPAASARTVARWLSQYLVTYTWPEPMVSQFSLTTRHDAGQVLTPAWMR